MSDSTTTKWQHKLWMTFHDAKHYGRKPPITKARQKNNQSDCSFTSVCPQVFLPHIWERRPPVHTVRQRRRPKRRDKSWWGRPGDRRGRLQPQRAKTEQRPQAAAEEQKLLQLRRFLVYHCSSHQTGRRLWTTATLKQYCAQTDTHFTKRQELFECNLLLLLQCRHSLLQCTTAWRTSCLTQRWTKSVLFLWNKYRV